MMSEYFSIIIGIIVIITTIIYGFFYNKILLSHKKDQQYRKKYIDKIHDIFDITNDINDKYNIYIQPYISFYNSYSGTQQPDKLLLRDYFIKKVFIKGSTETNTIFILFGDTGTGKTAALVHLYTDYINNYTEDTLPYNIKLISLREDNAIEQIERLSLSDRKETILLLDAMDESPMVQDSNQFNILLSELKKAFHDFARVVITCRPQLFPDNLSETEITQPHIRTSTSWIECKVLYLVPFDDDQINKYLDKLFSFQTEDKGRRIAENIIYKHSFIAIRPLILTYIRQIVESKREINTTLDFYDAIIENWILRDVKKVSPDNIQERKKIWWNMTSEVAGYMYRNNHLSISSTEIDSIIVNPISEPSFKQRSMLTRTGNEFHFSHKSFYEYFMAYRFLQHPKEIKQVYGMDFALQIYDDALQAWSEKKDTPFADLKNTRPYTVASSLNSVGVALDDINHFSDAERYYKLALELFRHLEKEKNDTCKDDIAMVLNNLAILHRNINQMDKADAEYNEALTIRRQLAAQNPDAYLPDVAMTLNNLANLHSDTNQLDKAEEEYNKALTIHRQLADKNPDAYLSYVAGTLNNLAVLHRYTNQLDNAEKEYNEALTTYRQLADNNPDAYLSYVAGTLNNLAVLHSDTNQLDIAEKEYNEALTIYRQLAAQNPDAYLPDVAMTLNNLANLHSDSKQLDKAEAEYNEALTTYRQLAEKSPDAYLSYVAGTLNNLAILHRNTNQYKEAEKEYNESLTTYRQLSKENKNAHVPQNSSTQENQTTLPSSTNRNNQAEEIYDEALKTYLLLADKNPDAYLHKVAQTLYNMALLHLARKEYLAAEAAAKESLEKYRIMAEKSHAAFDSYVKKAEELLERIQKAKESDA